MKRCPECEETKDADKFYVASNVSGLSSYCKECQIKRSLKRYSKIHTSPEHKEREARNRKSARIVVRKKFTELLRKSKCLDCGVSDPVVLVFHHRDPKEKTHGISKMIQHRYGWKAILEELTKCDCLCANCHFRRHYGLGDYRSYLSALSSEE